MGHSRPNRPGWEPSLFSFPIQVIYAWLQKITYTNFQIFLKISPAAMIEIVVALRAIIDSFEIYIINSLVKKNFEINFIMSIASF